MAALHRWDCILEVGGYDPKNLVEDYDLTIRYKELITSYHRSRDESMD